MFRRYRASRNRGFSLLAARPARQLLIVAFAVRFDIFFACLGKAFCSRKTAPTLEPRGIFVNKKTKTPL